MAGRGPYVAHLVPFAWHIGDGPRNAPGEEHKAEEEEEVPEFLMDAEGRQVTPWVRDQQLEDLATWKSNRRKLRDLLRRRNENLPDEVEEEGGGLVDEESF
ncbi:hypothetical protein G7046_g10128 [Stylonectria norvegica]|nr:hypothetical protein G7046_g10128 [Stylonectria norvegica]